MADQDDSRPLKRRKLNVAGEAVDDEIDDGLYSRQLYAIGLDAQRKIMNTKVLLIGLSGLGAEIGYLKYC